MSLETYPAMVSNGVRWLSNPYAFLDEAQSRHGLTFTVALPGMGKSLVTGDAQLIQGIMTNKHLVGGKGIKIMRSLFGGESLMLLHGETHRTHRHFLSAPFQHSAIIDDDDFIVQTTLDVLHEIPCDRPFSILEVIQKITRTAIIRIGFGELPTAEEAEAQELIHAFMTSFSNPWVLFLKPLRLNIGIHSPWGRIAHNRQRLKDFILYQLKNFRKAPKNDGSLLAHLMEKSDLSENDILNEIFAMLMFGHDTTAVTLAWAFAHIYSSPAALARLKNDPQKDGAFTRACLNESMRLSPAVVQLLRVAEQDVDIAGHRIKKDQMVMPCPYLAHHNATIFPEPKQFIPERFMIGNGPAYYSYFPFGLGDRLCIGKHLAQQQMTLMISTIIQNANLSLAEPYKPSPVRYMMFIAPQKGTLMVRKK